MALPISGAWKSIRKAVGGAPTKALANSRRGISEDLASKVSPEERKEILAKYAELEKGTEERKERLKKTAKLFLTGDEKAFEEELGVEGTGKDKGNEGGGKQEEEERRKEVETSPSEQMRGEIRQSVQAQIAAEPEKGDELEEAEKRGYERAMKEIKRQQEAAAAAGSGGSI